MHRGLPPIHLLVTFEAVARLSSVRLAAAECFVTPSAVSQQVKQLEDHLGIQILAKEGRGVVVTRAGRVVADWATRVVRAFEAGHSEVLSQLDEPVVRLSVTDFVSHELLIPALGAFHATHPAVELRIETTMSLVNFEAEPIDAAIRFGKSPFPGLEAYELGDCQAVLVGSGAQSERRPLEDPRALNELTLIYSRDRPEDWEAVARVLGVERFRPKKRLFVDGYLASMRAAEEGLGVAICLLPMTKPWLDAGRLTALTPAVPTGHGNYFVFRPGGLKTTALRAVYAWAKAEFDATAAGAPAVAPVTRGATARTRTSSVRKPANPARKRRGA